MSEKAKELLIHLDAVLDFMRLDGAHKEWVDTMHTLEIMREVAEKKADEQSP